MEKEKLTRKQIIPIIVGVLTLVVLVASATYAYFSVTAGNSSGTTTITGDIGGDTLGTVTLSGGNTDLYLGISAYDMSETNKGKIYYSSTTEGSRETSINNAGKTTYKATLTGDDELMYTCDYEFVITANGTMLGKSRGPYLIFEGDINQQLTFSNSSLTTQKIGGTWRYITKEDAERGFSAYLKFENSNYSQNTLAGTSLSVSISNTKWKCYLDEVVSADVGEAYALLIKNGEYLDYWGDEVSNYDFIFLRSETPFNVGDTYRDKEIIEVYTGFEKNAGAPWQNLDLEIKFNQIVNTYFEDEIKPQSTAGWFTEWSGTMDVTNLNVSETTNMSWMFGGPSVIEINGLSNWDVSNVTNMSYALASLNIRENLSDWDVSNVTNMSGMFYFSQIFEEIGIKNWDVSNVTDMSYMFGDTWLGLDIDLSGWNVSKVTNYEDFDSGIRDIVGKLTPPIWPTN